MRSPEFLELAASPWSTKARLALRHCAVQYRTTQFLPGLGEWWVRVRLHKFRGRISAPILFLPGGGTAEDSLAIAQWADQHTSRENESLFPPELASQVLRWNTACNSILAYGRSMSLKELLTSPEDAVKLLPKPLQMFGPLSRLLAIHIVRQFAAKWEDVHQAATLEKAKAAFQELRISLQSNGGEFVLGKLTFADLAMAVATYSIEPFGPSILPGKATCAPGLEDFRDLVKWRDQILGRSSLQ